MGKETNKGLIFLHNQGLALLDDVGKQLYKKKIHDAEKYMYQPDQHINE